MQSGSLIAVTAVVGFESAPEDVQHAMLLWIGENFDNREVEQRPAFSAFDALLCNWRRGA